MQTGYISSPVKTFINRRQHQGLREEEGVEVNIPPPPLFQEHLFSFSSNKVLCFAVRGKV